MLFSVVIPTCHRNDHLAECLNRLDSGQQTLGRDDYSVIVTDDGSTSTAEAMIAGKFSWARWLQGPRRGPAANRNCGAAEATAPWIVFCDDDCLPTPGFLEAYARAVREHPETRVFEGRTSADRPRRHPLEVAPINAQGGHLWSCNFCISRDLFRKLGGFNEQFPYAAMEDMDFYKRVKQVEGPALFVPEAEIIHPWRMLDVKSQARKHVASQSIYAQLHPEDWRLFTFSQHLKNAARYYLREFPSEVREFGWLAIRAQPLRWWDLAYRGWRAAKLPKPGPRSPS